MKLIANTLKNILGILGIFRNFRNIPGILKRLSGAE
jgi:hypothetical protein